ncbi:MAG: D-2-hydroxyacid dehydrogenase [Acidimicrobiales bacterium]
MIELLVSEEFAAANAPRLAEFSAQLSIVTLGDARSKEAQAAYFSPDCYPDLAAHFMIAAIEAPNLRWLQTFSAGVDHPIFADLAERGVQVTTGSGASAVPIAHAVVMHLLALSRGLPEILAQQSRKEWKRIEGRDLPGSTTVVLGFGPIGRAVAELLPLFGSRTIVLRRSPKGDEPVEAWPISRLNEALAIADNLVLALPANPDTIGIIDSKAIDALADHAFIVNVGRGELIDEDALIEACRSGRLGGAALDVFAIEPLPDHSPLWDLPNVIVSPHIAARTPLTDQNVTEIFYLNLRRFLDGTPLQNQVD